MQGELLGCFWGAQNVRRRAIDGSRINKIRFLDLIIGLVQRI